MAGTRGRCDDEDAAGGTGLGEGESCGSDADDNDVGQLGDEFWLAGGTPARRKVCPQPQSGAAQRSHEVARSTSQVSEKKNPGKRALTALEPGTGLWHVVPW